VNKRWIEDLQAFGEKAYWDWDGVPDRLISFVEQLLQRECKEIILKYLLQREAEIKKLWTKETKIKTAGIFDKRIKENTLKSMSSIIALAEANKYKFMIDFLEDEIKRFTEEV